MELVSLESFDLQIRTSSHDNPSTSATFEKLDEFNLTEETE